MGTSRRIGGFLLCCLFAVGMLALGQSEGGENWTEPVADAKIEEPRGVSGDAAERELLSSAKNRTQANSTMSASSPSEKNRRTADSTGPASSTSRKNQRPSNLTKSLPPTSEKNQVPSDATQATSTKNQQPGSNLEAGPTDETEQQSCCEPPYQPGDRVVLLVDNPGGAVGLLAGACGTVICCDYDDPFMPVMVSWDNWANGHNNDPPCESAINPYPPNSGWWMQCTEIAPGCGECCDPPYSPGDRVELLVDNPGGAVGLLGGACGIVVCCDYDDPIMPVMVSWCGWTNGHNQDTFCESVINPYPPNSGWWMQCPEIAPGCAYAGTCWDRCECAGQGNGDGTCNGSVDLGDLFALKAYFGKCAPWTPPECCSDYNQSGCIDLGDLFVLKANFGTGPYTPSTGNQNCP